MRKFLLVLTFLLTLCFSFLVLASDNVPTKRVYIFYKVPDAVLECQNSKDDIVKGREEFEETLRKIYEKRFIIVGINPTGVPKKALEYKALVEPDVSPLILTIELKGQRVISQEWQNAFGAKKIGYAPAVDMTISEFIAYDCNEFHGYGPMPLWWSPGTVAISGEIYTQTNHRKNTKNAIKWILEKICTRDKSINKYADEDKYKWEEARFTGNFLFWVKHPTPNENKEFVTAPR